jgi:hypothetical protein
VSKVDTSFSSLKCGIFITLHLAAAGVAFIYPFYLGAPFITSAAFAWLYPVKDKATESIFHIFDNFPLI